MAGDSAGAPRRKDAQRNRRRLLAAAREVFRDRGVAATLNDVAHHAGLGVGTAYRHFANKEELIDGLRAWPGEQSPLPGLPLSDDALHDALIDSSVQSASDRGPVS
jgi:AcrR family transcriptional regulator